MKNRMQLPGFLPPEKQDIVRFHVFKSLPYTTRMVVYLLCTIVGFLLQIITLSIWPGAVLLLFAALLNLVKGYNNKVELKAYQADSSWTQTDMDKIRQIDTFRAKLKKWDKDALDISNGIGCLIFCLAIIGLFVAFVLISSLPAGFKTGSIFIIDALILVLPIWFNGLRRTYQQDVLYVKTDLIIQMETFFKSIRKEGENFKPALMLARDKDGKSIPKDCRFTVAFDNMPADFYGIQAQININTVEGAKYPYFYCVIAAKAGYGLEQYVKQIAVPKSIIVKCESDDKADVIVIRKYTTKTSGYHTKINACKCILDIALRIARTILG